MHWIDRLRERLFGNKYPGYPELESLRHFQDNHINSNSEKNNELNLESFKVIENISNKKTNTFSLPNLKRALFICSGNICRSPYGAVKFSQLVSAHGVQVVSAGTLRLTGRRAALPMIQIAKQKGLDLESHRSSAINAQLIHASDVVFVMACEHRDEVLKLCPDAASRLVMLGSWLEPPQLEIEDPMGKSIDTYQTVANQIDEALTRWVKQHF